MTEYRRNVPHYVYYSEKCGHSVELPIRETTIWCPICSEEGQGDERWSQMKRVYTAPYMSRVWHEGWNHAVGRVISDPKQFKNALKEVSDRATERTGIVHDFQPVDLSDVDSLGVTEKGMDSTHDWQVKHGLKESKGKFVF